MNPTSILRNILRPVADVIVQFFCVNMIFACSLGLVVSAVAVLQFIVFVSLFYGAGLLYPLTTPVMIADFKAVGGELALDNVYCAFGRIDTPANLMSQQTFKPLL